MGEEGEDAKPGLWSLGDGTSGLKEDYTAPLMGRLGDGCPMRSLTIRKVEDKLR